MRVIEHFPALAMSKAPKVKERKFFLITKIEGKHINKLCFLPQKNCIIIVLYWTVAASCNMYYLK